MNQTHYKILKMLYDKNKYSAVESISLKEITDCCHIKLSKISIYKQILTLTQEGYVNQGLRIGKENTYYITQLGINAKQQLEGVTVG